jgi:putative hydrolase of the HAD superfamily
MLTTAINTLIFDLDNTLIDRNAAMRLAVYDLLKLWGYQEPKLNTALEDIITYDNWGYTDRSLFCDWLLHKYIKGETWKKMTPPALLTALQVMIAQRIQPDPSIQTVLHFLTTQFQLVLASNGGSSIQRAKLRRAGLESFFQPKAIFISGEMKYEKPNPAFFQMIIQQLQLNATSTLVIGDNLVHDIMAPALCGILTCWVSHGRENEAGIRPNKIITNITEISKWSRLLI